MPTQKSFANAINRDVRKVRHLEAMTASDAQRDANGMEFFGMVYELMDAHQLTVEAAYSIEHDEIRRRGPLMQGIVSEALRLLNNQ